jgi:polysaccharide deacetylase family protein (PEP-CTERM system associated)
MINIMTVDCEDWYHTQVSQKYISSSYDAKGSEDRVSNNTQSLLDLMSVYDVKATFFVLGSVAENHPELVKEIERKGHRLGAHAYRHRNVYEMDRADFEADTKRVKDLLNNLISRPIESFRAPNWSINGSNIWALDVLKKLGFKYDSSFTKMLFNQNLEGGIIEVPRCSPQFLCFRLPLGGAFLKILPLDLMLNLMESVNRSGMPFMLYVHPWEIDPAIPRIRTSWADNVIQYHGLGGNLTKIKKVLERFRFTSMEDFFDTTEHGHLINKFYYKL